MNIQRSFEKKKTNSDSSFSQACQGRRLQHAFIFLEEMGNGYPVINPCHVMERRAKLQYGEFVYKEINLTCWRSILVFITNEKRTMH